jgi:putative transcriptional regulator
MMPNHPNRSRHSSNANPQPESIRALRESAGLSQTAFGVEVHSGLRTVQDWESGQRRMHPGLWELVVFKNALGLLTKKSAKA